MTPRLILQQLKTLHGGPFSLSAEHGECVALSGPSGCGKTLLLRAIADLDPSSGGEVFLDGVSRETMTAPQWRRRAGWLSAESAWWQEHVGDHFVCAQPDDRALLGRLGFSEEVLSWRVDRLSTGEKQRLALVRLLLNQPKALLLDEPTAALDRASVLAVEAVIADYRRQTEATVLWVSHDPEQIARVAVRHLRVTPVGLEEAL
jgi:ABC-type iron transport system FetAB ATPase subunit